MEYYNTPESTTLEQDVESALLRIRDLPGVEKFRCYEYSRLIGKELNDQGHNVVVRDGIVDYDFIFLSE